MEGGWLEVCKNGRIALRGYVTPQTKRNNNRMIEQSI